MCVLSALLLLWGLALLVGGESSAQLQDDMAPTQVEFHSLNFRNVLHWKHHAEAPETPEAPEAPEASEAPDDLQYFVEFKVYGDKQWSVCEHCQAIHKLQCDLSHETSDPRQWYYARVQSRSSKGFSPWVTSARFYPQWDTTFSPPKIKLNVTQQGIVVWIKPPRTPQQGQKNSRISVTKLMKLMFRIYLMHNGKEQVHETEGCQKKLLIEHLSPQTTYCVQAVTVMPLSDLTSPRSPRSCISTL
ncbi:interleukin-22 receptor subunit alpha-2 [Clarias gariepinus]|uniref:interleukin-22 receptor subunit alpha-2 n=1 Tax=Clarias gariepinus TaxID=13013 RepID=UPI00234DACA5|nr:interleukin-22 receptor subunit alpha-2 [Clarias gariepinus]